MKPTRPRLRLAVVSDALYPWHDGGKETRYQELLSRMAANDVNVHAFTMKWWAEPIELPFPHTAISPLYPMYDQGKRSMLSSLKFAVHTFKMVSRPRIDLIEADHMPYLQLFPLRLVCWIRRIPLVVTWHELWGADGWDEYLGGWKGKLASKIEHLATKLPDHIVAVSAETTNRLIADGVPASKLTTLTAGLDTERLDQVAPSSTGFDILVAGRHISHKRIDLLLRALAILNAEGLVLSAKITGSGPETQALTELATELDLDDQLHFTGPLESNEQVWSLMKAAKLVVSPSEREGYGISIAESLACGTPVIVSDHSENASRHLVQPGINGSIFAAGDADDLANSIRTWIQQPTRDASSIRATVENQTWDATAAKYAEVLRSLL